MLYLERIPAAPLAHFIRTLWYARAGDVPRHRERVLPERLRADHSEPVARIHSEFPGGTTECRVKPALVVGARSVYEIVDTSDMADLIGIVFAPGRIFPCLRDAADRSATEVLRLRISGVEMRRVRDRLREIDSPQGGLTAWSDFFCAAVWREAPGAESDRRR